MIEHAPGGMELRRTCLHRAAVDAGGRMVEFAGWEMPVQFAGIVEEHLAVRRGAGMFDVSHMGEIQVEGRGALDLLQGLTTNDVARLRPGQAQYTVLTTPEGTCVDDLVLYRLGEAEFLLCVNAANEAKDFGWIRDRAGAAARVTNRSREFGLIAVQGPLAARIVAACTPAPIDRLPAFHCLRADAADVAVLIARTGYTGEDGFELYTPWDRAEKVWERLLEVGKPHGLVPAGLGARDTLRLEARLLLYGNDIDATTTPWEAGLRRFIHFDKGEFLGRDVLLRQSREGAERTLVGFEMVDAGVPRRGYPVLRDGAPAGAVTSGGHAPFLRRNIGLAYLPPDSASPAREIEVEIRGSRRRARVVQGPFYRRGTPKEKPDESQGTSLHPGT